MNVRRVVGAGLIASVIMGMIEMIYEAVAGAGFWSPVVFIGATILRGLQSVQVPVPFLFWGVLFGLMGHMMNSVIFGLIFAWIVSRRSLVRGGLVVAGVSYAVVIFVVMWYVIVPAIDPVMLKLNATVFAIAHIMWGAALGLIVPQARAGNSKHATQV
jgi:hypothetical protein